MQKGYVALLKSTSLRGFLSVLKLFWKIVWKIEKVTTLVPIIEVKLKQWEHQEPPPKKAKTLETEDVERLFQISLNGKNNF